MKLWTPHRAAVAACSPSPAGSAHGHLQTAIYAALKRDRPYVAKHARETLAQVAEAHGDPTIAEAIRAVPLTDLCAMPGGLSETDAGLDFALHLTGKPLDEPDQVPGVTCLAEGITDRVEPCRNTFVPNEPADSKVVRCPRCGTESDNPHADPDDADPYRVNCLDCGAVDGPCVDEHDRPLRRAHRERVELAERFR